MSAKLLSAEAPPRAAASIPQNAFGYPRDFMDNRFVYLVISSRARGLSIGVNMNPNKFCNFDCVYCEVERDVKPADRELDIAVMAAELEKTLYLITSENIRQLPRYARLEEDLLQLRHVAFSGDGEPTLCAEFARAVQAVVHVRARRVRPFFKLVLLTNGTWLDLKRVQEGLQYFTSDDEIWIKLDAGSQEYMDKINRSEAPLAKVLQNILEVGRRRPVIIQSMFPMMDGQEPPPDEIDHYIHCLNELKEGGANIPLVQIYSAVRPVTNPGWGHLPLRALSNIRRRIHTETSLRAEVF